MTGEDNTCKNEVKSILKKKRKENPHGDICDRWKCVPGVDIIWKLVRQEDAGALPRPTGQGPAAKRLHLQLQKPPDGSDTDV